MKDFKGWINESVLPTIRRALDILKSRTDQQDLVNRIQEADPYQDKRFAPIMAGWIMELDITPEEHADDVREFKELHKRLKGLRVPAINRERTALVKGLLSKKPEDFASHYSLLQDWNKDVSGILDPGKDLSDEGLPVVMRHNGYTMYKIDRKKQCQVPLVKNAMSWCVTKGSYGKYGGPPYYPIVRDSDKKPFAMIIPSYFDTDPSQAVRNAQNDGRLSPRDLDLIRPLVQRVLPLKKYTRPYINAIHAIRPQLPENPSPMMAFDTIADYAIKPGEWPEGESAVARDAEWAYLYAYYDLKSRFPQGEPAISKSARISYLYAKDVVKGPFPQGEPALARNAASAYNYAVHVLKGPFPLGERSIADDEFWQNMYEKYVLKAR